LIEKPGPSLEHIAFKGKTPSRNNHPQSCNARGNKDYIDSISDLMIPEPCRELVSLILDSAGLSVDAYRAACLNRRLTSCLRTLKASTISEAHSKLIEHPELNPIAVDSLIIGVTEFFRDAAVFDALKKILLDNLSNKQGLLHIWSAGCSNGAELYSLAILLAEAGLLTRSNLVGTDCRHSAIREAQAGLFSEASLKVMNKGLRQKYMRNAGGKWQVSEPLHRQIHWRVQNLLSGCEKGPWDIILWRNVAIYLKTKPALQIWDSLIKELRPGGLLVVGKAEQPPKAAGLLHLSPCVYQLQPESTEAACC
jgi:chemotaxis methyl-accepting protein methylase